MSNNHYIITTTNENELYHTFYLLYTKCGKITYQNVHLF